MTGQLAQGQADWQEQWSRDLGERSRVIEQVHTLRKEHWRKQGLTSIGADDTGEPLLRLQGQLPQAASQTRP